LPQAPTTGTSYYERINLEQYLFKHYDPSLSQEVDLIIDKPIPVPQHLYVKRICHLPVPRSIPMPTPDYPDANSEHASSTQKLSIFTNNKIVSDANPACWFERICASTCLEAIQQACHQIKIITPMQDIQLLQEAKIPNPTTIKFATFGRKPVPGNFI
jgi:hypothetical protein